MSRPKPRPQGLERWVGEALARDAASVLLVHGEPPCYRIQGRIVRGEGDPLTREAVARMAVAAVGRARLDRLGTESGVEQALLRLSDEVSAVVNVARSAGEPVIVALPVRATLIDVEHLRLPPAVVSSMEAPHGLVLLTGPSGCGKTTTAFALLEHVNATRDAHVVLATYVLEHLLEPKRAIITERRVGADAPDMVSAVASGLQQDPDVLYVGEVRDVETLGAGLAAAETGHLVLTQLHQATPAAAIRRIIDLHPPELRTAVRDALARTLRCVLTQRLLPRADGRGRVPAYGWIRPDDRVRAVIASGDLGLLDSIGPPAQATWEEHARALVRDGVAAPTDAAGGPTVAP
jgi:twitching motility protein PilT